MTRPVVRENRPGPVGTPAGAGETAKAKPPAPPLENTGLPNDGAGGFARASRLFLTTGRSARPNTALFGETVGAENKRVDWKSQIRSRNETRGSADAGAQGLMALCLERVSESGKQTVERLYQQRHARGWRARIARALARVA